MKQGKTLQQLAAEIERQHEEKIDYVADTRHLKIVTTKGRSELMMQGKEDRLTVKQNAHNQIATKLGIPRKYYDRLKADQPALLDANVNGLFQNEPEKRMIRTLDGEARAFLSDRYRPLDNFDLAHAVLPILSEVPDMQIISADLTENNMFIKALFPRIETEVQKGDVVQSGIVISNSETGHGSLKVEPLVYRLVCLNGMIAGDYSQRKYHIGRASSGEDSAYEVYRDETLIADDRATWLKIQDTVKAAIDRAKFEKIVGSMREAMNLRIEADPVEVVQRVQKAFTLTDDERGGILRHLIQGADLSAYGVLNAITRQSQDVQSYERATDLERMGGQIINLSREDWRRLAA